MNHLILTAILLTASQAPASVDTDTLGNPSPFSTEEMAPALAISDRWVQCAFRNLNEMLPNDFDPVDAIGAATVDRCIEGQRYQHAMAMLFKRHSMPLDQAYAGYERMRTNLVRFMAAEVVRRRSSATRVRRGEAPLSQ